MEALTVVAGYVATAWTSIGAIGTIIGPAIQGAIVGAVVGGLSAAITGGDIGSGVLYGAVGGAVTGAISGAMAGTGAITSGEQAATNTVNALETASVDLGMPGWLESTDLSGTLTESLGTSVTKQGASDSLFAGWANTELAGGIGEAAVTGIGTMLVSDTDDSMSAAETAKWQAEQNALDRELSLALDANEGSGSIAVAEINRDESARQYNLDREDVKEAKHTRAGVLAGMKAAPKAYKMDDATQLESFEEMAATQ